MHVIGKETISKTMVLLLYIDMLRPFLVCLFKTINLPKYVVAHFLGFRC